MKVCIIRNAEAESNASIIRMIDALIYGGYEVCVLSRNREMTNSKTKIIRKDIYHKNSIIKNFEIQLPSTRGAGNKNIFNLFNYMIMVFVWLRRNASQYDIIHSFDLDAGFPASMISKIYKKKFVYHIADFYVESRNGIPAKLKEIIKKLEFSVINKSDLTIVCTKERIEQINGSNPNKVIVIHNTPVTDINEKKETSSYNIYANKEFGKNDKLKISYVGGLSESRFIKEILEIVSQDNRLTLEIAGYGSLSKLVEDYDKKFKNIKFFGQVDYSKSLSINERSDLMIAMYDPSFKNNQYSAPNKVYESMNFGKPIIVAKGTGVDRLVNREKIGFISDYDVTSFQKQINYIFEKPNLFNEYKANTQKIYPNYSWNKMKKRLIKEYKNL